MASIADVLRHLIAHAPGLSDDNRQEFLDAVTPPEPAPEPAPVLTAVPPASPPAS
jgi:hypothetical protein